MTPGVTGETGIAGDDAALRVARIKTGQGVLLDTSVDQDSSWGVGWWLNVDCTSWEGW